MTMDSVPEVISWSSIAAAVAAAGVIVTIISFSLVIGFGLLAKFGIGEVRPFDRSRDTKYFAGGSLMLATAPGGGSGGDTGNGAPGNPPKGGGTDQGPKGGTGGAAPPPAAPGGSK